MKNERGKYRRKQNRFSKIDVSQKNVIRHTIYGFYQNKIASKLKEISAGTDCKFPYGRTMLHTHLVKIEWQYQKADNHKVIMKSPRFFAWRYKYLIKLQKYREDDYLIVYLDEIQFVSHDTVCMVWSGGTKNCLCQDHCREENEQ